MRTGRKPADPTVMAVARRGGAGTKSLLSKQRFADDRPCIHSEFIGPGYILHAETKDECNRERGFGGRCLWEKENAGAHDFARTTLTAIRLFNGVAAHFVPTTLAQVGGGRQVEDRPRRPDTGSTPTAKSIQPTSRASGSGLS
jgi:hypothetical protein